MTCDAEDRIRAFLGDLTTDGLRRRRDRSLRTWLLSALDKWLFLGYWWFRPFQYERRNSNGSIWQRYTVRRTLAGYTIPWGLYVEYYDHGTKSCEGLSYGSPFVSRTILRKYKYWLPNGTSVSQAEWMRYHFGPDIDGCADPAWEE
jgi:hypothetical protein